MDEKGKSERNPEIQNVDEYSKGKCIMIMIERRRGDDDDVGQGPDIDETDEER